MTRINLEQDANRIHEAQIAATVNIATLSAIREKNLTVQFLCTQFNDAYKRITGRKSVNDFSLYSREVRQQIVSVLAEDAGFTNDALVNAFGNGLYGMDEDSVQEYFDDAESTDDQMGAYRAGVALGAEYRHNYSLKAPPGTYMGKRVEYLETPWWDQIGVRVSNSKGVALGSRQVAGSEFAARPTGSSRDETEWACRMVGIELTA